MVAQDWVCLSALAVGLVLPVAANGQFAARSYAGYGIYDQRAQQNRLELYGELTRQPYADRSLYNSDRGLQRDGLNRRNDLYSRRYDWSQGGGRGDVYGGGNPYDHRAYGGGSVFGVRPDSSVGYRYGRASRYSTRGYPARPYSPRGYGTRSYTYAPRGYTGGGNAGR